VKELEAELDEAYQKLITVEREASEQYLSL
jgi:hypothetical protein